MKVKWAIRHIYCNTTARYILSVGKGECNTKARGEILATSKGNESWPILTSVHNSRREYPTLCSYWGIHRPCKTCTNPRLHQFAVGRESQADVSYSDCTSKPEIWYRRGFIERHKRQVKYIQYYSVILEKSRVSYWGEGEALPPLHRQKFENYDVIIASRATIGLMLTNYVSLANLSDYTVTANSQDI